ncbi:hypothetical protein [Legionella shakespearei]|uniref:DUF7790 domain-containing protein n=1 Tax=Legionella shakespearei DSM 23087 TaxID=1122169 RepID=A0A0W0YL91_9GAMM|nr:hypothetical protein [Legionella shakespearei]KTD57674.1 hypothetical protein Lsha_2515 [Legionella shakespearei DSM 23087]
MSTARIEKLLQENIEDLIPVPRLPVSVKEDPISRRLRRFDNLELKAPMPTHSGVYINTNERGSAETARTLAQKPLITQACHIGFSGWHNFDIMAQRLSTRALICDINPENALFLYHVLKLVGRYTDRQEFVRQMSQFVKKSHYVGARKNIGRDPWLYSIESTSISFSLNVSEEPPYDDHYSVFEEVELEFQRPTSWLFTDERYAHIRRLALTDKIALITESICAVETFASIAKLLRENSVQIDTVYVSNISEWIDTPKERDLFRETVQAFLSESETILIDGKHAFQDHATPKQRSITKKELTPLSSQNWFFNSALKAEDNEPRYTTAALAS